VFGVSTTRLVVGVISALLEIDVEVEEPETSENPMQSFEKHNIVWRRTQLLAVIISII
jgi:hypothetical protein